MITDKLTDEEQAFFDTGNASELPADYVGPNDVVPANEPEPKETEPEGSQAEEAPAKNADVAAAAAVEGQPAKKNTESVPLATFLGEKKGRQSLERTVAELNEKFARADERLNMLTQPKQQEPAKPSGPPNPEEDIIGGVRYAIERISEFDQRSQQSQQQREQQEQARALEQRVIGTYAQIVQERTASDPSFTDAQNYLINSRYQELLADGHEPQAAQQMVHAEEFNLVHDSFKRNINPADRIAAIAKSRGWAPKAAEAAQTNDDADKLARIAQGQAAAASLSTAGTSGTAKSGKVDAKALADMSDKQFKDWLATQGDEGFREALGG